MPGKSRTGAHRVHSRRYGLARTPNLESLHQALPFLVLLAQRLGPSTQAPFWGAQAIFHACVSAADRSVGRGSRGPRLDLLAPRNPLSPPPGASRGHAGAAFSGISAAASWLPTAGPRGRHSGRHSVRVALANVCQRVHLIPSESCGAQGF